MSDMEFKDVGVSGVKIIGDPTQGIVEAWVSTTNIVDDGKDNIQPGAYKSTLERRIPKGVWSHDMNTPVSKTIEIEEIMPGDKRLPPQVKALGAGAVRVLTQFNLNTTAGKDAYENVTFFGDSQEWSIGYAVPNGGATFEKGIRLINQLELYEYSPVLFGMAPGTSSVAVKALTAAHNEKSMVNVDGSWEDTREDIWEALTPWVASQFPGVDVSTELEATFPDRIVICISYYSGTGGPGQSVEWEVPYTLDDATDSVTFGTPREVEVVGMIQPDNDDGADTDAIPKSLSWERKEGRVLSASNLSKLQGIHDQMAEAHKGLADVIAAHGPKPDEKGLVVTNCTISDDPVQAELVKMWEKGTPADVAHDEPELVTLDARDWLEHERLSSL